MVAQGRYNARPFIRGLRLLKQFLQVVLSLYLALACSLASAASVVFLNPGKSTEAYWLSYAHFMQAAATDLGMPLQVIYAERDPQRMVEQARALLQGSHPPDYLVFVNEEYAGPEILRLSKGSSVKLFAVSSTLTADQQSLIGQSRERYPNWIGSLVPNDEEAGYLMASRLIERGRALQPAGEMQLLAFSGAKQTPAAQFRERGLQRALAEHPEVRLRQLLDRLLVQWEEGNTFIPPGPPPITTKCPPLTEGAVLSHSNPVAGLTAQRSGSRT